MSLQYGFHRTLTINSLESVFEGERLITILTLRSNVQMLSNRIGNLYETQNLKADDTLSEIRKLTTYITTVTGLVRDEFFSN